MHTRTRKHRPIASFNRRLLNLISEPEFIQFENILNEPNFFKVVGRAHYERWHSCFIGWLLDPNGSHLLANYSLIRFLALMLDERCLKPADNSQQTLLKVLPTVEFSEVDVRPNEYLPNETSIIGVGRFDIFVTAAFSDSFGQAGKLNLIVELKIDSKPSLEQSKRYADWLNDNHPQDLNLLAYLTPTLDTTSIATVGDARWYCMDYQLLNDKLLEVLPAHPNLNERVKPFIIQYTKNLKTRYRGIKMAITEEEKRMAVGLYEKYSDVFDSIYDALVSTGTIDYSSADIPFDRGRATGRLAVKIDGRVFTGDIIRDLFSAILPYLVDNECVRRTPLPWGISNQRYIITNAEPPLHPNGRDFFYPVKYKGYTLESHYARERGLKVLRDLCDKLEITFEVIET